MLNLFSNLALFWLWETNDQWKKNTASLRVMKLWCTRCWIPVFQWEFKGRWGAGDDFSGPDWSLAWSPWQGVEFSTIPQNTSRRGKGCFSGRHDSALAPLCLWREEGCRPACSTCGKEGLESHVAIYSPQIFLLTGVRWHTVPSSPPDLNPTPTLPSQGGTQGSDACYQSNRTNAVPSDVVHCISIIT